jgi:hypothetical protein
VAFVVHIWDVRNKINSWPNIKKFVNEGGAKGDGDDMRKRVTAGAASGLALTLLAASASAQSQQPMAAPAGDSVLENGSTIRMSDKPLGSVELAPDRYLSVRTYQYLGTGLETTRQPVSLPGYRPSRDGSDEPGQIDGLDELGKAWDYGGIIEYGVSDPSEPRTRAGVDVRIAPGDTSAHSSWLLQPGANYTMPLSGHWQFNGRVYSTLSSPNANSGHPGLDSRQSRTASDWVDSESTFKDVGFNLGVAYDLSDSWHLGTGAGFSRAIGKPGEPSPADEQQSTHQFFGGVVIKYKF